MYKSLYLSFVLFGIILFLIWNGIDTFSIGIPICPTITTQYTDTILDWSTAQNPYGIPMFDNDTTNYLDQGSCGTCQTYALTSCLSANYNIEVYKINENNCDDFTPITISPRSIIDIFLKYILNKNDYVRPYAIDNHCGLYDYFYDINSASLNSWTLFTTLRYNLDIYPLIKNNATKKDNNQYMNIKSFPDDRTIFDESLSSLSDPNFNYTNIFNAQDLIYLDYGDITNISLDFTELIYYQLTIDNTSSPYDILPLNTFISRLKDELKQGPIILSVSIAQKQFDDNGILNIIDNHSGETLSDMNYGGHNILLIGYNHDNAIILNSWQTNLGSDEADGTLQYYITNDIPLSDIYGDFMNWYDINRGSDGLYTKIQPMTQIFRINISIPTIQEQMSRSRIIGQSAGTGSSLTTRAIVAGGATLITLSTIGAGVYCAATRSRTDWHFEEVDLEDQGP